MAAGLGFKTFTTGEVLTSADTNGYLMQGVLVFASAAARDAAITSPQEGQFAYLKDTNVTTYYTGSAWANLDTTGMTNPMTTTGDMVYSSSGSTPARLGIGSTGQVLTVASGLPSWATPAGGGKVLQVVQATYSTTTTIANTALQDTGLTATITPSLASSKVLILVSQLIYAESSSASQGAKIAILRGATNIFSTEAWGIRILATGATSIVSSMPIARNYLDSPSTTSATTYKVQAAANSTATGGAIVAQEANGVSSIILLEIGA